jgi:hypothetical protein
MRDLIYFVKLVLSSSENISTNFLNKAGLYLSYTIFYKFPKLLDNIIITKEVICITF